MDHARIPQAELTQAELTHYLISHLNRIYCAKSQLVEKLPQLARHAHFLDLEQAIGETVADVQEQLKRMQQIFILLDSHYTHEACTGLAGMLDEAFQSIGPQGGRAELRDFSILFYMQNIESIEKASFNVMMLVADKLNQADVVQLLRECYDEATEDLALFRQISAMYI